MALVELISRGVSRLFERKSNPIYGSAVLQGLRSPAWTSANYTALANEGYVQNAVAYSCINHIASAFGGVKWGVFKRKRGGKLDKQEAGPLVDLIAKPNPMQGQSGFMAGAISYRNLAGNTYIYRNGPDNKAPKELWLLRSDKVKIEPSGDPAQPIKQFIYDGVKRIEFEPDKLGHIVLHWKTFHPLDDFYGLSPMQVAARRIDLWNAGEAWNVSLFQNEARPSGLLVMKDGTNLPDDQFRRLKDQIRIDYAGSVNAGLPMLLEAGLDWKQLSLSPREMDWLKGEEATTRVICLCFKVPPELLGFMTSGAMNDTNFVQARRKFYMETILPELDSFRDELNGWLVPLFEDDLYLDYDRDDIEAIQEDRDIVWARAINAVKGSVARVDEGRAMTGLPPLENGAGNVVLVPSAVQPLNESVPPSEPVSNPVPADRKPVIKPAR